MKTSPSKHASPLTVTLAFATIYLVWGSTYFFIQMGMEDLPPFILGAFRFLLGSVLLFCWCFARGEKIWHVPGILRSIIAGILLVACGNGGVVLGEQTLPSAVVAILWSAQPLVLVLIDRPNWKANFRSPLTLGGLATGFAGVGLLFGEQLSQAAAGGSLSDGLPGMLFVAGGTVAFSIGSVYSKRYPANLTATAGVSWQMLSAMLLFMLAALISGDAARFKWHAVSTSSWLAVAYLAVFGSVLAFSAFMWLLKVRSAAQVSTYAYVNPVVAILLGVFFAAEEISWLQLGGLVLILLSVLAINISGSRRARTAG
ncbi:EamA family transporter [Pedobacter yulinensis]|uniref:EamA family transporter n=1 Tax=Pedobacter yulinensis TaxID=2126353 RepID=A0A2T3HJ42_9SPHI|nr:EamA family transporter [Pedobacter yulinensis]PST82423.1 EamA family transporter [Pedobacter yulinensis]